MTSLTNGQSSTTNSERVGMQERIPTGAPYLSVVATARNDNHGGDLLARMQVFVNILAAQCERHRLDAELVLVEWNPPDDRPRLVDALEWPETEWCTMRIVEVSHELHARLEHSDRLPLFQMIAKNVGIRRARGEFVLATNIDILFPDELVAELARRELHHDKLYRLDRHDVDIAPDPSLSVDETLSLCNDHVIRVCARKGTTDLLTGEVHRIYQGTERLPLFARRLLYYWRAFTNRLHHLRRFWQSPIGQARLIRAAWDAEGARMPLHTNASGDFTLLSREGWKTTRAYPELEVFSMHLDGLFLYQAHYAGYAEAELGHRIFHIEHNHGFKPAPKDVQNLNERLERAAIPQVTSEQFMLWITAMHRTNQPLPFNDDGWGFAAAKLVEVVPTLEKAQA